MKLFLTIAILSVTQLTHAAERPNIVFLLSDDQRPDTIAALGNEHISTPHLDWLVKNGTTMTRAICANPICTPSRAEILTGCTGFTNGVLDFGGQFQKGVPRWAETLKQAGYRTCYVGKWHNKGRPSDHGYAEVEGLYAGGGGKWAKPQQDWFGRPVTGYRGWVFQSADGKTKYPNQGVGLTADISTKFAAAAIRFLDRQQEQPFFLQVNFTAPHDPLLLPPGYEMKYDADKLPLPKNFLPRHPFDHGNFEGRDEQLFQWPRTAEETRGELAAYYAVISHMDAQIGRIIATLRKRGQLENTILIFASDHGLGLGSHGLRGKQSMYEHTIGVPLLFVGPGIPKDKRSSAQCYLRDLFPTSCELARVTVPKSVEGKSLVPVLQEKTDAVYPAVFGYFRNYQRMIRTDRWKLIHYPQIDRVQLFDLRDDPHELRDLAGDAAHRKTLRELRTQLTTWQESHRDPAVQME